jgi:histone deacetylase complex regulatory component SIN3
MSTVRFNDAFAFLDAVKRCYADRPQVYQSFLDIMKDFKTQRYLPLARDCDLHCF